MTGIERKAVLILQEGEWPDNPTHGLWRAECMVEWLHQAGIVLVDAEDALHRRDRGAVKALERIVAQGEKTTASDGWGYARELRDIASDALLDLKRGR